ncbi:unnamed protein product, partial [Meganyctiphanes norvegica]
KCQLMLSQPRCGSCPTLQSTFFSAFTHWHINKMNAIISVCHFCELHGPSVVFCTQAFRNASNLDELNDVVSALSKSDQKTSEEESSQEGKLWKYGSIKLENNAELYSITGSESCIACRSFTHNKPGYISNDDGAHVSYVSSQFPMQPDLHRLVRQACIRSLSCEVCPSREGPIYFGDEARGHVLSYSFFLKDVQARGFQRWYSILVLMKDKMFLLNSWPFLVKNLQQIINQLQESAAKIYGEQESKVSHRSLRSAASMMEPTAAGDNFKKQRVAGQPRSLVELVGSEGVWLKLHTSLTWLLKAGGLRLQERLVEGPPIEALPGDLHGEPCLSISELYSTLGPSMFHRVLHHLLIGHQLVIRCHDSNITAAIVLTLKPLLPRHCYNATSFSMEYIENSSANILGLHSSVEIPESITENICILDLVHKNGRKSEPDLSDSFGYIDKKTPFMCETKEEIIATIRKTNTEVSREGPLCTRPPQALSRIETAITNVSSLPGALSIYIATIVDEWMNKVKVWVHVIRHGIQPATGELSPANNAPLLGSLSSANTLALKSFVDDVSSCAGPSINPNSSAEQQQQRLLTAIGAIDWDIPLLTFWAQNVS